jgi:UDP-N-acetylglucosamine 2-epimerase
MTGAMLAGIEKVLLDEKPRMVLVFGDTNSTLAGALAASKLHIPVAHVEAGLRSFNRRMPEELNRICTDHLSDLLFCSSETGRDLLAGEGITKGVHIAGDVMADVFFQTLSKVRANGHAPAAGGRLALLTLHRAENTDDPARLRAILQALEESKLDIVFPMHPRTRGTLAALGYTLPGNVRVVDSMGYCQMVSVLNACTLVLTDSGGLQKEALWAGKPCVTLRDETEWPETVASGWNTVTGANPGAILEAVQKPVPAGTPPVLYGDGQASGRIAEIVAQSLEAPARIS